MRFLNGEGCDLEMGKKGCDFGMGEGFHLEMGRMGVISEWGGV